MRVLLARAGACVFVPIRPMQFLAVVDAEEVIFIDSHDRRWVEVAWRDFRPALRAGLDEPVPYVAVYYREGGRGSARRIHAEFPRALALLSERGRPGRPGRVLALGGGASGSGGDGEKHN
jgi:hypothetical protein